MEYVVENGWIMGPEEDVQEEWFGSLIDVTPEELAESLFPDEGKT